MLTAIHKCFDLVEKGFRVQGSGFRFQKSQASAWQASSLKPEPRTLNPARLTLADVPAEDPAVYAMIGCADTVGVFQIESRAQMSMLPRLRPRCFYDLVIEVAIVRPGPIQGQMVHPYLRRRDGLETVDYPNDAVRAVLEKTLGVPLFQEQAMRLAVVAAGFTPGDADKLRRAMGAWRRPGIIEMFRTKFMTGMAANGYTPEFAERLFRQIQGFGEYGFPESHAASFALLVYVSAWLKRYFPAAFTASLLNSQPMGFYAPAQLIRDAREHGVEVRPVDVNASDWDCTLERTQRGRVNDFQFSPAKDSEQFRGPVPAKTENRTPDPGGLCSHHAPREEGGSRNGRQSANRSHHAERDGYALRLGLRMIRGLAQTHADRIVAARGDRPFESLDDFTRRTGLSQAVLVRLTKADAFGSLRLNRRAALWQALAHDEELPLFRGVAPDEPAVALPKMEMHREVVADYRTTGLSLKAHPIALVRSTLNSMRAVRAAELAKLPTGRHVRVAGLVLVRQRPSTAKGITFVTLEDETGIANLIVHPDIWARHHRAACHAQCLFAHGRLERQGEVIHIIAARLEDLSSLLAGMASESRDFH
jgi:error-prone DNA polymerase